MIRKELKLKIEIKRRKKKKPSPATSYLLPVSRHPWKRPAVFSAECTIGMVMGAA